MKKLILATSALAFLAACENISNRTLATTAGGAIIGAGLGTLAGGDDGRNAAIGAAVGAIAGAGVGVYMSKQEEALRQRTAGTGIEVERRGDQIALNMPSGITFQVDSATIQPSFYTPLDQVAQTLVDYPSTSVDIIGHASSDGSDEHNQLLSERRAASVKTYLIGKGLQGVRATSKGMGERQPVADNATEAGRVANRRVEIILTPIVQS